MSNLIQSLTDEEALAFLYDWRLWARPSQRSPDVAWFIWLLLSGRGGGKTRVGSETVIGWASEGYTPIALVGETKADARDIMVEVGDSSIIKCSPPWFIPFYEPSKRRLTWPNGVQGIIYSGDEPDQLRGPQHMKAWVDELAKYGRAQEAWDNLMFGLRIGDNPQAIVTTTPRPIPIIKQLENDSQTVVTRSHMKENMANLAPSFLKYILDRHEGTRLGRQELAGETLEDNPDALWHREQIDKLRVTSHPDLFTVVVGVDPEAVNNENSAETGIITVGIGVGKGGQIHAYVLADDSMRASPLGWGSAVVAAYNLHQGDRIVGEANNGGDMVESTIRTISPTVNYRKVHASKGKYARAEPVSALYEQGRIHHVGFFPQLEDQLCEWVPGEKSPDRLDALVWAINELMLQAEEPKQTVVVFDTIANMGAITPELDRI